MDVAAVMNRLVQGDFEGVEVRMQVRVGSETHDLGWFAWTEEKGWKPLDKGKE